MKTLTKNALALAIYENLTASNTITEGKQIVEDLLTIIKTTLIAKEHVALKYIGKMVVNKKASRPVRNPKTLEEFIMPEHYAVTIGKPKVRKQAVGKADIAKRLSTVSGLTLSDADSAIDIFLSQMYLVKQGDHRIEIRELGTFYPKVNEAGQTKRNPKTGESVVTEESIYVRFKCSKSLLKKVNA